ncbi:MAG: Holliday junction branch migration DNA helicase RuvB [Candidatus Gracilibacteria bacterium]|nr:Holliday junction branch migration DNA helicase RuvB [Candidatus Gracilibacteria bacterium]
MVIESSNKQSPERVTSPKEKEADKGKFSNILRPLKLEDYVGQESIKKHLSVSIASSKIRGKAMEHILFYGPPGLGKTTLSNIISTEMETNLKSTSGPAIEKQSDLVSILSNLESGDILFIDEIHRLRPQVEEILYTAMEDFEIDIMVGSGTGAQSVKLPLKEFTLVGATTRLSALSSPLRDRFGNVLKLDFYNIDDISLIIHKNASKLDLLFDELILETIAKKSRGTPRIANRLLKIVRDYHTIGKQVGHLETLETIFKDIGIDELGLDYLDRKYLSTLYENFNGGPVGLNTLASSIGEEEATLEDVVEPYLLQIGFLERTPRGRKISGAGINHLQK